MGDAPKPKRYWEVEGALEDSNNPDTFDIMLVEAVDENEAIRSAQPKLAEGYGRLGKLEITVVELSATEAWERSDGEIGVNPSPDEPEDEEEGEDQGAEFRERCEGLTPDTDWMTVEGTKIRVKVWRQHRIVELVDDEDCSLAIGERATDGSAGKSVVYEQYQERMTRIAQAAWNDNKFFAELLR